MHARPWSSPLGLQVVATNDALGKAKEMQLSQMNQTFESLLKTMMKGEPLK